MTAQGMMQEGMCAGTDTVVYYTSIPCVVTTKFSSCYIQFTNNSNFNKQNLTESMW